MSRRSDSLVVLGGSALALACAPKVSAAINVDATRPPTTEVEVEAEVEPEPAAREAEPRSAIVKTQGDRPGPPQIVRAEQLTANLLRLTFSERIAPIGDLDPNDFRISALNVYVNQASASSSYAYYYDWGYQIYAQVLRFVAARAGTIQLDLEFEPAVPQYNCRMVVDGYDYSPPGVQAKHGLFLHYAAGSIPIADEGGTPLQNFGADWVIQGRADPPQTRLDLHGAEIPQAGRTLAPIHCGPELPSGPR